MKKNWGSKRALAVILSASLAFSPAITANASNAASVAGSSTESADTGNSASSATASTDSSTESSTEENASANTSGSADEATGDSSASKSSSSSASDSSSAEDSAAKATSGESVEFEEVDPEEEGLEALSTSIAEDVEEIPVEEKDPEEQTRVIIVMEGDSVIDSGYDIENIAEDQSAINLSESIIEDQDKQVEKIADEALDGEELEVNYNFTILTNAVSAEVAYKDIEKIEKVDGVEAVYVAQLYEPMEEDTMTITSGDMVGSYTTWAEGYTGAGTRIAVIDTGIDADHPSFDGGAFDAHIQETAEASGKNVSDYNLLCEEEIANVLPYLNATQRNGDISATSLYLSEKIPFAFNYVDKNLDITHDNDEEGDHGTHVSGIATANAYVPNSASATGYSAQANGVVGIAPDAQLITMKVFGTNGGAYSDDYMAAIEDAILLNADVINLSLGSSAAGYSSDSEAYINEIFEKLEGTSTVVSISAGNSGRWSDDSTYGVNLSADVNQDTVGSPGSYTNAFTVASAVNSGFTGNYFEANGARAFYVGANDTLAPEFKTLDTSSDQTGTEYPYVFLDAKGEESDYEGIDVTDKIVFVQRGSITFGQKQMNAEAAGAKAVVIYNNTTGSISMTMQGSTATIPAASITLAEAQAIANASEQVADNVYEGTIKVVGNVGTNFDAADGYTMSTFSSYGVPGTLDLKPEITAPGGNIYSTRDDGTYGNMSGTSMAAPSISGQTALVEQYIKENNLADVTGLSIRTLAQSLLMSTATPLHEGNDASQPEYSPRSQGAGLANVHDAVSTPAYILVGDKEGNDGKVKAVLGDDPEKTGNYSFDFDVYNMTNETQYYVLDSTVMTEQLYDAGGVTYFSGTSHVLSPSVSLSADDTVLVYDLNGDGKINKKDRKIFLQVVNGSMELPLITQNEDYFDFNADGVVDTKDVYAFTKQLKTGAQVADFDLRVVEVKTSTKISVNINLSDSDREYLAGFENGMYVDGFIYVKGNVDLSVPFLAFYGSWMDSSMFENFDFEQYAHDAEYAQNAQTYCGISQTNFLSIYPLGVEDEYYYIPNRFADDAKYIADRNAISSENGTVLGGQYYSLIRNASRVIMTITDKSTGEVYFKNVEYENYAEFSYNGAWKNYLQVQDLFWAGTDAEGNALADGTQVDITIEAVPSYYDDVEDPSTLTGKGLYMTTPMTIDNTRPVVTDATKNDEGQFELTLYDNRYSAAVIVLASDKKTIIGRYAVNQEVADEDTVVTIDVPEDIFYVEVFDYACNASVYRFNNTGHADTKIVSEISVDKESVTLNIGEKTTVTAKVGPEWLAEGYDAVEWMSLDEDIATVTQDGVITAVAEGQVTIMVATMATDKKGNHLTATVEVTVVDPDFADAATSTSTTATSSDEASSNDAASNVAASETSADESQDATASETASTDSSTGIVDEIVDSTESSSLNDGVIENPADASSSSEEGETNE
ncbi:MAG: S8 family serine peptidase [Butyrivibrio sp.]|nr:S8 family serine peptidase [Butyrivibrio sp.]